MKEKKEFLATLLDGSTIIVKTHSLLWAVSLLSQRNAGELKKIELMEGEIDELKEEKEQLQAEVDRLILS